MSLRNRKKNPPAAGASRGGKPFWKSAGLWWTVVIVVAAVVAAAVTYQVMATSAEAGEELAVTESRDSSEPPDTAAQPAEERQIEIQGSTTEVVATTPTTSPATTTVPELQETEGDEEAGTEEESEVPTAPASQNVFGNGEGLILVEAYSLSCPACARYHPVLKQLRQEYENQITFQVVHFPLAGMFRNSRAGHQAVEAAAKQGKFWQMHDILFERHDLWAASSTGEPLPQLEIFAEEIGLDLEQFRRDFHSEEIGDVIDADELYLASLGVHATPAFFLNGERVDDRKLSTPELARETLNGILGIEPEEETVEDPEEGAESGEAEEEAAEDPEEGSESGEAEEEAAEDPEEGSESGEAEADEPLEPVMPSAAWMAWSDRVLAFEEACGLYEGDSYTDCRDPADTETLRQIHSDFFGCDFVMEDRGCRGLTPHEQRKLGDSIACPKGFYLAFNDDRPDIPHWELCYPEG